MQYVPMGNQQNQQAAPRWNAAVPGPNPAQLNANPHPNPRPNPRPNPDPRHNRGPTHPIPRRMYWQFIYDKGGFGQMGENGDHEVRRHFHDRFAQHNLAQRDIYGLQDPADRIRDHLRAANQSLRDLGDYLWQRTPFVHDPDLGPPMNQNMAPKHGNGARGAGAPPLAAGRVKPNSSPSVPS